jgi:hypothetical protein
MGICQISRQVALGAFPALLLPETLGPAIISAVDNFIGCQ